MNFDSLRSKGFSYRLFPLEDHFNPNAETIRSLFAPSAGAFYVYRPSKRRRTLTRVIDRLEASFVSGFEYVLDYSYDKYRRNHSGSSISQTGRTLQSFLSFYKSLGRENIHDIQRRAIAAYVEHEMERGLKVNSVINHLRTVYAFLRCLVDNDVLPDDALQKKIRIKLPELLPRAIPAADPLQILGGDKRSEGSCPDTVTPFIRHADWRTVEGEDGGHCPNRTENSSVSGGEKFTWQNSILQHRYRTGAELMAEDARLNQRIPLLWPWWQGAFLRNGLRIV